MASTNPAQIVFENVTVTSAPEPSLLQQQGAFVSVGGTTLATNSYQYCGSVAALTAILSTGGNYAELTNMATTFVAQGTAIGFYVLELGLQTEIVPQVNSLTSWITGNPGEFYGYLTPADWDGALTVGSVTITDGGSGYTAAPTVTFSAPTSGTTATGTAVISSSGVVTSVTITNGGSGYTTAPSVTFSAPTSGTTATGTANLVNALDVLAKNYAAPTGKTYFFGSSTASTIGQYSPSKSLFVTVPAPTAPSTEFTAAAMFYNALVNNPSLTNILTPMQYRYLFGVTPWVQNDTNNPNINTILNASGNIVLTGAQGGISESVLFKGLVMSGAQFTQWYGLDWFQINSQSAVTAAVIEGSNSQPPLLYRQSGINTLEGVAQVKGDDAISFGCLLSATTTATPFTTYTAANPTDYANGIYNGLQASATSQNGFLTITFNINVSNFPS